MNKLIYIIIICITASYQSISQILPREGRQLNYRIIGFSFPKQEHVVKYEIEIASGCYYNEDSFKQNIIKSKTTNINRIIVEVPDFGKQYTWRVSQTSVDLMKEKKSVLHHFSTSIIPCADTNVMRLRIIKNSNKYTDAYVFLDGTRALYDMNGKPVWYLPDTHIDIDKNAHLRDLKLSSTGTVTCIVGDTKIGQRIYEVNYNGDVLWRGPDNGLVSGDTIENYHHEFTKLDNGHYMALGSENYLSSQYSSQLASIDTNVIYVYDEEDQNKHTTGTVPFGTLIEYDAMGKIVWSWKSSGYFKTSDIRYRKKPRAQNMTDVHDNGFFFDEKDSVIYMSFRNISRVIKIKYPEGVVLAEYGETYKPGFGVVNNNLFCGQHSSRSSEEGYLYLFNNNSCNMGGLPKLTMMLQVPHKKNSLKRIWEYDCVVDSAEKKQGVQYTFSTDGNVIELPHQAIFASMSSLSFSKVFIVSKDKKIQWSAIPEKWNSESKKWEAIYQYRASIINTRKDLESLIWNSEDVIKR